MQGQTITTTNRSFLPLPSASLSVSVSTFLMLRFLLYRSAQAYDTKVAKQLALAEQGIAPKRWNTRQNREALSAQRHEWGRQQMHQRRMVTDKRKELETEEQLLKSKIDESLQQTAWMKIRINELKTLAPSNQDAKVELQSLQVSLKNEHTQRQEARLKRKTIQNKLNSADPMQIEDEEQSSKFPLTPPDLYVLQLHSTHHSLDELIFHLAWLNTCHWKPVLKRTLAQISETIL